MESINLAIGELRGEVTRQRDEIAFLRTLITADRVSTAHRPKPSLPDPEKFSGSAQKFDTWLPAIRAKLRVDGLAIGDSTAQFYYVYLNLESHVQAMVLPQLSSLDQDENVPLDYLTILDQLKRVYNNPNKVQEAEDRLYTLKQGTDSLQTYIAKFERTLYEARGQTWPDSNKISTFRNGLNTTLRNRLAQQLSLPRSYSDFVQIMQQLAARSAHGYPAPSHSSEPRAPHILQNPSHSRNHDPMDVSNVNVIGALDSLGVQPGFSATIPSVPRLRAPEFSPAERTLLRKENKCVRCGSPHHWVRACPLDPHQGVRERKEPVPISAMDILDDDSDYDEEDEGEIINGRYFEDRLGEAQDAREAWQLQAMHVAHQEFLEKED